MRRLALGRIASLALLLMAFTAGTAAQPTAASVDEIKAAYIQKFAGYVDWPPAVFGDASAPFVFGVVGSEKVYAELTRIAAGRLVQGRPVQVRRLVHPEQATGVHVLFIGESAWKDTALWLAALKGRPVAVVTDAPGAAELGAMLAFVQVHDRVRFEASLPAAEQAGLKLSSRLLAVAERVIGAAGS